MNLRSPYLLFLGLALAVGCGNDDHAADGGVIASDLAAQASCTPTAPAKLDPTLVAMGQTLVDNNKCRSCHGQELSGNNDGVYITGSTQAAYPPNLTPDLDTGLGCWTDAQITNAILLGIDNQNQPICPPMPHFSEKGLVQADALAIAAYLRSLPLKVNQVPDTPACQPWGQLGGGCIDSDDCPSGAMCSLEFCVPAMSTGTDAGS